MKTLRFGLFFALVAGSLAVALPTSASAHGPGGGYWGGSGYWGLGYWGHGRGYYGGWGSRPVRYVCPGYWRAGVCIVPVY